MEFFLQGFMLGLAYVAPIGTQNMFVINSACSSPFPRSIVVSIIVAFFDVALAVACFYDIVEFMRIFGWLCPAILLYGGAKLLRSLQESHPET